jgi:nitrogen fixation protein FixH
LKPGTFWPLAVAGVLALTVAANVALIIAARDPNAYVVEPDYYRKAVQWDSTMAEARASAALGWRMDAAWGRWSPGGTELRVALQDSTGAPLGGAAIDMDLINNLAPEHVLHAAPADQGGGLYRATVALPRPGLWELRVRATRGAERFWTDLRRDVVRGSRP